MSGDLLLNAWAVQGLKPSEKLVLLFAADIARPEHGNMMWSAVSSIATATGLYPETVKQALASLTCKGHLRRQLRPGHSTLYAVHPTAPGVICPPGGENPPGVNAPPPQGEFTPQEGGQNTQGPGGQNPPVTIIQPSIEPSVEPPTSPRVPRAHRLPVGWSPCVLTAGSVAAGIADQRGEAWVQRELAKFTDHWAAAAGRNATKHDWQAAWRTWIVRADDGGPSRAPDRTFPERNRHAAELRSGSHRAFGREPTINAALAFISDGDPG